MTMPEYVADTTPFTELHEGLARIHAAQTILLYCARELQSAAESARAIADAAMDECAMMANDYPRMDDARIPDIWRILRHAYAIRVSADCIAYAITERDPYA